jgi:hypothetical protein
VKFLSPRSSLPHASASKPWVAILEQAVRVSESCSLNFSFLIHNPLVARKTLNLTPAWFCLPEFEALDLSVASPALCTPEFQL